MEAIDTAAAIFRWIVIGFVGLVFLTMFTLLALNAMGKLPPRWSAAMKGDRRRSGSGRSGSDSNPWGDGGSSDSSDSGGSSDGGGGGD